MTLLFHTGRSAPEEVKRPFRAVEGVSSTVRSRKGTGPWGRGDKKLNIRLAGVERRGEGEAPGLWEVQLFSCWSAWTGEGSASWEGEEVTAEL